MRKIETVTVEYVFSEEELKVIKECVSYARHRCEKHPDSGIHKAVSMKKVIALEREIGKPNQI